MEYPCATPLEYLPKYSERLGIDLWVKRDDLFPRFYGGNKARKIGYILKSAIESGCNAIVTAGSPDSNHARVCALAAAKLGWKCTIILHPNDFLPQSSFNANIEFIRMTGAVIHLTSLDHVSVAMNNEMEKLSNDGFKPYYIFGGGHCVEGSLAYYQAVSELVSQLKDQQIQVPDFLLVASGTGSTQAGLHLGAFHFLEGCRVIGVSVARHKARGEQIIKDSVNELINHLNPGIIRISSVNFTDAFAGRGYGDRISEVESLIPEALELDGLTLDPIYTGKAFYGLIKLVESSDIPKNSRVIFWHTGGLINLFSSLPLMDRQFKR